MIAALPPPRPTRKATSIVLLLIAGVFGGIVYAATHQPPTRQERLREEVKASPPLPYILECTKLAGAKPDGLAPNDPRVMEQEAHYRQCIAAWPDVERDYDYQPK